MFYDDRDVEFIQFKRWMERLYDKATLELDYKSCEMIADDLASEIQTMYPILVKDFAVQDNENGCEMEYP